MGPRHLVAPFAAALLLATGCGTAGNGSGLAPESRSVLALDLAMTRPVGIGPRFRPPPLGNPAVLSASAIGQWRCRQTPSPVYGAHVELFAQNHEVQVPGGIGIAPPQRHKGVFVLGGRCGYPLQTVDPTGVVRIAARPGAAPTLGQLFTLWGQRLSPTRLTGFSGQVQAFVGGRRWRGDPRAIPLSPHAQIVLELGPRVRPHATYLFPLGL